MNLHISAPSVFIDRFHRNLVELGIEKNNKIILRSEKSGLDFPSAKLYSRQFDELVGDTRSYENVFIHQLNPLLYRWITTHEFQKLNWMVWGADLYNLPELESKFYEPLTLRYCRSDWDVSDFFYRLKVRLTATSYKEQAYSKVDSILTWMNGEFNFAKRELPVRKANHSFFFYENPVPYKEIQPSDNKMSNPLPVFILGNSAARTNNHLDVLTALNDHAVKAKLILPVAYGDKKYISFLKRNANVYTQGTVEFMENLMSFDQYLNLLRSADGLIMNTLRPQGYGNIFMMLCMGKPVFLNDKNVSLPDLRANGIYYSTIQDLLEGRLQPKSASAQAVTELFSREKLMKTYSSLFS